MSANFPEGELPKHIAREASVQYGGEYPSSLNADVRRELYKYADDGINIWQEIAREIVSHARPGETLLDVGTGSGTVIKAALEAGHHGKMIGLDIHPGHYMAAEHILRVAYPDADVQFMVGDAQDLPIEDASLDMVTNGFLLYHLPDPRKAVQEYHRVLKPGGTLIVASRDVGNHERMWEMGNYLAGRLGVRPPQSFYWACDLAKTRRLLDEEGFQVDDDKTITQDTALKIPANRDGWLAFYLALTSLLTVMVDPRTGQPALISDANPIIEEEIMGLFFDEVDSRISNGTEPYFEDRVRQGFFVAHKPAD